MQKESEEGFGGKVKVGRYEIRITQEEKRPRNQPYLLKTLPCLRQNVYGRGLRGERGFHFLGVTIMQVSEFATESSLGCKIL